MKEEKLEQLRAAFKAIISELIEDVKEIDEGRRITDWMDAPTVYTNKLLYEVKIRINDKEG